MWPFSSRTSELIDESWLNERSISIAYRDAFGRKASDIKAEIKRNSKNLEDAKNGQVALEAELRVKNLELEKKEAKKNELKKKKGAKHDRNLEIVDTEIGVLDLDLDRIGIQLARSHAKITTLTETIKMLQAIKSKRYKTPAQMTEKAIIGTGDRVSNLRDSLPRRNEVDNSDIINEYAEEE